MVCRGKKRQAPLLADTDLVNIELARNALNKDSGRKEAQKTNVVARLGVCIRFPGTYAWVFEERQTRIAGV